MNGNVIAAGPIASVRGGWPWRMSIIAILTVLADWLLFRQHIGLSIALFMLAVCAGVLMANQIDLCRKEFALHCGILVTALLPILVDLNVMSVAIAVLGAGAFALGVTGAMKGDLRERCGAVAWYLITGPFQFFRDLPVIRDWARERGAPVNLNLVQGWIVPLVLGAIFLGLFAAANPLIGNWLMQWRFGEMVRMVDIQRLLFWFGVIIAVWAFVCVCTRFSLPDLGENTADLPPVAYPGMIFNDAVILRSLVLFNLLFAMQTVMDIQYLWRGAALPDGMSHASYAHRGAYPLIATALLAALFVIVAMRPGSDAERSPVMRALVFIWVGQNVLLVVSSILRLDLYVETYLLTYWRVAAFIWMLIVAAGLILIVVRIVTYRSNAWLFSANLAVLVLVIYVCSLVNFANLVASYNVAHSRESNNAGRPIDLGYLISLGPQAIPALDRYSAANPVAPYFSRQRDVLAARHLSEAQSWRAWTFRGWRLARYLETSKLP